MFFKHWVLLPAQGYIERPPTGHAYEVLRIAKYTPNGDNPDVFFYLKDPPTQHVTLDRMGEALVRKWLRIKKPKVGAYEERDNRTFGKRFDLMEQLQTGAVSLKQYYAQMKDMGYSKGEADNYLDDGDDID